MGALVVLRCFSAHASLVVDRRQAGSINGVADPLTIGPTGGGIRSLAVAGGHLRPAGNREQLPVPIVAQPRSRDFAVKPASLRRIARLSLRLAGGLFSAQLLGMPAFAQETVNYRYDPLGRMVATSHSGAVNNGLRSTYTFDGADNRVNVTVSGSVKDLGIRPAAPIPRTDFNGDGRDDILWRNDNGTLSDWLSTSNGSGSDNYSNTGNAVDNGWHVVATGDFNGDGRDDILWRNSNGTVVDWLGQANGGFTDNAGTFQVSIPNDWHVVGTGDFNGDGRTDLLWRNDNGDVSDWLAQSNGSFTGNDANAYEAVPTDWHIVGAGDVNGDGKWDVIWRNDNGDLTDWLGTSTGGFTHNGGTFLVNVATRWKVIGTGDFNGDGRADILWRSTSGEFSDWLGQTNGSLIDNGANSYNASTPLGWHIVGTGDYNGDGKDDILWRNDNGTVSNWLGQSNGGFVANSSATMPAAAPDWHIVPGELPW